MDVAPRWALAELFIDVERFAELIITLTSILMEANIALVLNNARVAARIAAENCGSD